MADASEVGRYGTIRLMKRHDITASVASFPIDDEIITFGRDPSCSVRLYYQWVSSIHCKLIFQERKAFLQVFGGNGVVVDGCQVVPINAPNIPATVPLVNGSSFEIYKKRFQFNYPPKELRPQLFTPRAERRRSLRMSMIQSAQVFSPQPSNNPRENLRVLQSPLKLFSGSDGTTGVVKLVEGDSPTVVKEDQDLIIFEDVDDRSDHESSTTEGGVARADMPTPEQSQIPSSKSAPMQTPVPIMKTPRRRSAPSLHRAVLIRSAQRAAQRQELQVQSTQYGNTQMDEEDDEYRETDVQEVYDNYHDLDEEYEEMNLAEDDVKEEEEVEEAISGEMAGIHDNEEQEHEEEEEESTQSRGILAPLGQMLRSFAMGSKSNQEGTEVDITEATDENEEEDNDEQGSHVLATPGPASRLRQLGPFLTPQLRFGRLNGESDDGKDAGEKLRPQRPPPGMRFSLGGPGLASGFADFRQNLRAEFTKDIEDEDRMVPIKDEDVSAENNQRSPTRVTEEERRAILARRKSAAQEMIPDFDHVPGTRRTSTLPSSPPASPFKNIRKGIEDGEDTKSLITKMQETIEGMQRGRQSFGGRLSIGVGRGAGLPPSPRKLGQPLFSPRKDAIDESFIGAILEENEEKMSSSLGGTTTTGKMTIEDEEEDEKSLQSGSETKMDEWKGESFNLQEMPVTPSFKGVRESFLTRSHIAATPKMDGMRKLFQSPAEVKTPAYDGIESMLNVPEEDVADQLELGGIDKDEEQETKEDPKDQHQEANKKPSVAMSMPQTALRKPTRVLRGTPTDSSTLADDEATPDSDAPKRRGLTSRTRGAMGGTASQSSAIPEGAVIHRSSRLKRPVKSVDEMASGDVSKSITVPEIDFVSRKKASDRRDKSKDREAEAEPTTQVQAAQQEQDVEESNDTSKDAKPLKSSASRAKVVKKIAKSSENETAPARRNLRTRSASVEPDRSAVPAHSSGPHSEPIGTLKAKRGAARGRKPAIDTISEEETATKKTQSRSRKAPDSTERQVDTATSSKMKSSTTAKRAKSHLQGVEEDDPTKEDKENTPSPVSPSFEEQDISDSKTTKVASTKKAVKTGSKSTTKSVAKEKTSVESTALPRATRARTRK